MVRRRFSYDVDLGSQPNSVVRAFYVVIIWQNTRPAIESSGFKFRRRPFALSVHLVRPSWPRVSEAVRPLCGLWRTAKARKHVNGCFMGVQYVLCSFELRLISAKFEREY